MKITIPIKIPVLLLNFDLSYLGGLLRIVSVLYRNNADFDRTIKDFGKMLQIY
jgi:hypothetical protein